MTGWICLALAGACEIAWALGLKYSEGFTRLWPTLGMLVALACSFVFLAISLRYLPFGTAYAVWGGIGAAGTMAIGILVFQESADFVRVASLIFILTGIAGLKLSTPV